VIGQADLPDLAYEERLATLGASGVGLWDTIASARRSGSLDAAIREAEAAPLRELVATLPALRAVGFNGAKAAAVGRRALAGSSLALIDLPSSSPANAGIPFLTKQARWLELAVFLR